MPGKQTLITPHCGIMRLSNSFGTEGGHEEMVE